MYTVTKFQSWPQKKKKCNKNTPKEKKKTLFSTVSKDISLRSFNRHSIAKNRYSSMANISATTFPVPEIHTEGTQNIVRKMSGSRNASATLLNIGYFLCRAAGSVDSHDIHRHFFFVPSRYQNFHALKRRSAIAKSDDICTTVAVSIDWRSSDRTTITRHRCLSAYQTTLPEE